MIAAFSFRDRNSVMNRLDPRARWIFSLAYTLAMMLSWDWRIITPLFILGVFGQRRGSQFQRNPALLDDGEYDVRDGAGE